MATPTTASLHEEPTAGETYIGEPSIAAQTETPAEAPLCPICQKTDEVRTIQAAFDVGVERIAPPVMPASNARMAPWIVGAFAIYLAGNFYLFVELGANSIAPWPMALQIASDALSFIAIVVGLVLSYLAIVRMVRADKEERSRYPTWDRAMDNWNRLYYCLRDNAVIAPEGRVLSEAQLRALITTEDQEPQEHRPLLTHGDIHAVSTENLPKQTQDQSGSRLSHT